MGLLAVSIPITWSLIACDVAVPVVDVPAVGVVGLGQAAGYAVPRVDRHRAGGAAVDVVRRPR